MQRRFFALSALFALLFLAACQPVPMTETLRTVAVSGEGEISVAPEIATVHLAVEARDRDLAAAQAQAGKVVDAVLELTDSLKIPRKQVSSTQLRVHPEYDWNEGRQVFRGYLVQRDIQVELQDLAKLGPLLERAMAAGVNNVSPPELNVEDPRKLHREVLQLAAADAKANAEALAETLDATLGDVQRVNAVEDAPPRPLMERMMPMSAADSASAEQTYQTGQITMRVTVQAEFELR
ncbi:MAG TPA: SIMPL domain-containing protein [Gammaproteobacteria bacterium]